MQSMAVQSGAYKAVVTTHHAQGGQGAAELAQAVIDATNQPSQFSFLYPLEVIKKKHRTASQSCSEIW